MNICIIFCLFCHSMTGWLWWTYIYIYITIYIYILFLHIYIYYNIIYIYMYKYVYVWYTCAVCIRTIGYHRYAEVVSCFLVVKFVWHAVPFSISQDPYVCESNIVPNLGRPAGEQPGNAFFYGRTVGTKPWIMTGQDFSRTLGSFFLLFSWRLTMLEQFREAVDYAARGTNPLWQLRYMVYARFWIRRKPFYFIASLLFPTAVVTAMGGFAIMVAAGASPNSIVMLGSRETWNTLNVAKGVQLDKDGSTWQRGHCLGIKWAKLLDLAKCSPSGSVARLL